jgi:hypothetical protein
MDFIKNPNKVRLNLCSNMNILVPYSMLPVLQKVKYGIKLNVIDIFKKGVARLNSTKTYAQNTIFTYVYTVF